MDFPPKSHWVGMLLFVFAAIFVINSVSNYVPAVRQFESGLGSV